ncbi:M17 family metallopeptidase [Rhodosalinus sp. FB01]|uniref:leucyl aminopeptidase family protein n=1 Tax=Rhodosalinus sp. FB01 TaxID=3239194 RepID=UPI0035242BF2
MTLAFAPADAAALPLWLVQCDEIETWRAGLPETQQAWARAAGFGGGLGEALLLPGPDGAPAAAAAGYGTPAQRRRERFALAAAAGALPPGDYRLAAPLPAGTAEAESLGWLLAGYRFDRYRAGSEPPKPRRLVAPEGVDAARVERFAAGEALARDLVNTPAADMGPGALEAACAELAGQFGARMTVTRGEALAPANLPMIHAVGRAGPEEPRLVDMSWGETGPRLTLVGKGVCFDTGGLNLKPAQGMALMKKDMGGAATVLGLARMIMDAGWPVRLRVLIPAVENAGAGHAMRPGDILTSRKGLTVEINHTDAEGRLVLADALALADEEAPEIVVSMATLTGAARVAVGPDLAPFYTGSDGLARAPLDGGARLADPVWRMPFHDPYETMIEPGIADLDNAPSGGFAGSITAALFLRRFVEQAGAYAHFDIYGWQPKSAPGRPRGGAAQGARALFDALPGALGL